MNFTDLLTRLFTWEIHLSKNIEHLQTLHTMLFFGSSVTHARNGVATLRYVTLSNTEFC